MAENKLDRDIHRGKTAEKLQRRVILLQANRLPELTTLEHCLLKRQKEFLLKPPESPTLLCLGFDPESESILVMFRHPVWGSLCYGQTWYNHLALGPYLLSLTQTQSRAESSISCQGQFLESKSSNRGPQDLFWSPSPWVLSLPRLPGPVPPKQFSSSS